jgi:hypothetical protein
MQRKRRWEPVLFTRDASKRLQSKKTTTFCESADMSNGIRFERAWFDQLRIGDGAACGVAYTATAITGSRLGQLNSRRTG